MAGIFNLFGNIEDPIQRASNMSDRGGTALKPAIRHGAPGSTPAKLFGSVGGKAKGLSMRSFSDLNVNVTGSKPPTNLKSQKPAEPMKVAVTQMDVDGRPISPGSKDCFPKIKDVKPLPIGSSSPKLETNDVSPVLKNPQDDVFKIPLSPTVIKNSKQSAYPEPEKLSYYYDEEEHFLNIEEKPLEADFEELVATLTRSIQTYDDEGFESDPEMLPCAALPELKSYSMSSTEEKFYEDSIDLPDISGDEF